MEKKIKNLAIFGGSFDPPHLGHLGIVKKAFERLNIDKLIILVAFQNPFKNPPIFESKMRLQWVKEVFLDSNNFEFFKGKNLSDIIECSDYEIAQNRTLPSIESIKYFKNLYKCENVFFLIGSDNLKTLHKWHDFSNLKKEAEFVVFNRADSIESSKLDSNNFLDLKLHFLEFDMPISSSEIRQNIESKKEFIPLKIRESVILNLQNKGE